MWKKLFLVVLASFALAGCGKKPDLIQLQNNIDLKFIDQNQKSQATSQPPKPASTTQPTVTPGGTMQKINATRATIKTEKGDITVELYTKDAPNTVQNFLSKAESGYYNNLTFHRVESWVVQGGDPRGNGTGGGSMPTELNERVFELGSLGVARGGDIKISNDSQFFICTDDCSWLTGQYTNFGKVIKGMDIAKKMQIGDKILGITYK